MPSGHLPLEVHQPRPTGRRSQGRPRTRWRDYISHLAWERLVVSQEGLEGVAGERDVWDSLPAVPAIQISGQKRMDGWMDGWMD